MSILIVSLFTLMTIHPSSLHAHGSIYSLPPFERAVCLIKYFEGWHTPKDLPYVGYGHLLRPHEVTIEGKPLPSMMTLTPHQADSLLRKDLRDLCRLFRRYGKHALLLATLAYNVGPYKILGNDRHPKSRLLQKIEAGSSDFKQEYVEFCRWKGKKVKSIERRRYTEWMVLWEG